MIQGLLGELVVAYGVGVLVVLLLHRLRVPTVVGFLVAGVLLGPHGLGLVKDTETVTALADIGVVILLFTIGVEMSLGRVLRMGTGLLVAGLLQMALSTAGIAGPLVLGDEPLGISITLGILVAVSSTTLLMRTLGERGELDAPQGRISIGISIVQDLCVVPIMILLPMMGGVSRSLGETGGALGKAALVLVGTVVAARVVVPRIFELVVATRSRELFALTVVFLCLGTAYLASLAGLSLALGAFLGGLVVSESPYSQQVLGEMLPLRDALSGLFFIGVGMLLDVGWASSHPGSVVAAVAAITVVKTVFTSTAVFVAGYDVRTSVLVGVALCQVGEFSFVLAREAGSLGLLDRNAEQLFLASAVLTMIASPFLYRGAPRLADRVSLLAKERGRGRIPLEQGIATPLEQHVVIVGYGVTGRNVGRALTDHGVSFVAIEMNPVTVRTERAAGVRILYGDAGHPEVLEAAGVERARLVVVVISDVSGTRRVIATSKRMRPELRVLVRTRYLREVPELRALGADEVVPDELETSVEIFARVLRAYDLPSAAIEQSVLAVRSEAHVAVRSSSAREGLHRDRAAVLAHVDLETHVVAPGSAVEGRSLLDLALRSAHGVTVAGVRRLGEVITEPGPQTRLQTADVVILMGTPDRLAAAAHLFRAPGSPPESGADEETQ